MPPPFDGFDREQLRDQLDSLVVSHKPDHGTQGKLHEETAYGLIDDPDQWDGNNLVYRKAFSGLTRNEIERIRDPALRRELLDHIYYAEQESKPLKQALADFNEHRKARGLDPIRRVRLLKKEGEVIAIGDRTGRAYKAYSPGDNHHVEIYQTPDGRWHGEAVTMFQANQPDHRPAWRRDHPDARLVVKLHKGDLLKLEYQGREQVMRVVRLEAKNGRLRLAAHHEGGDLQKRHDDRDDPFRWFFCAFGKMKQLGARPVRVDVLGRVADPGPPG
jgi:CRISPR-associated endonuclease Csn1